MVPEKYLGRKVEFGFRPLTGMVPEKYLGRKVEFGFRPLTGMVRFC